MRDIERFISGFRQFQKDYFGARTAHYERLKDGQNPRTMLIGCSDSRVDPTLLTNSQPGDLFTVRNIANLVPPCERDLGKHGVSAALEYAVCELEVEDIVVMGHSNCGGIQSLMRGDCLPDSDSFIKRWMSIAAPALKQVREELKGKDEQLLRRALEQAAILLSIENLHSFPFIEKRMKEGKLSLHGWYFDMNDGHLLEYDYEQRLFVNSQRGK
ncbi:MAG: carbonic anhydrase [Opitutales bacterium]|nr:carbonic anhydrase [Opitutales bacterium]